MANFTDPEVLIVSVSDRRCAHAPHILQTTLGSCVGIVLYSPAGNFGGLAHTLLSTPFPGHIAHRGKYVSLAIPALYEELQKMGPLTDLRAQIFGGASMFDIFSAESMRNIGVDNIKAAREGLRKLGISIAAEDVGGQAGRTIAINLEEGKTLLRSKGQERWLSFD